MIAKRDKPAVARSHGVASRSATARTDEKVFDALRSAARRPGVLARVRRAAARRQPRPAAQGRAPRTIRPGSRRSTRARRTIHFEMYIIHEDEQGRLFADALIARRARACACGCSTTGWAASARRRARFWNRLRAGGVEVRCYNPPRFDQPLRLAQSRSPQDDRRRRRRRRS